jgi:trigger factor
MQVSVESTGNLERRMTVKVPEERVSAEVQQRLERLSRTAKVKGFRPGKVPFKVIQQQYGAEVRNEVIGDVVQSTWYEAVVEQKLRPAGHPTIEAKNVQAGQGIEYTATFEVLPEIKPADLKGAKIQKVASQVTDADVEKIIENLRKQRAVWVAVERTAKNGDRLVIDFKGTIDGQEFKGNEGKNVPLVLGSGSMIPGFEEGLVGAKAGEDRTVGVTFPDNYGYKEVAGKAAQFAIKVTAVEEPHLPELNDEFAKHFGLAEGSVANLRAEVRKNMERELQQALTTANKQAVMDKIVELNNVEVPHALVQSEANALMEQMRQNMHIPKGKNMNLGAELFEPQAKRRVVLGLVIAELVKAHQLKADPEKVRARIDSLASSYEHPEEVVNWYYSDKGRLAEVESLSLEDEVVEWVLGQADTQVVEKSFDDVMNPAKGARV